MRRFDRWPRELQVILTAALLGFVAWGVVS